MSKEFQPYPQPDKNWTNEQWEAFRDTYHPGSIESLDAFIAIFSGEVPLGVSKFNKGTGKTEVSGDQ